MEAARLILVLDREDVRQLAVVARIAREGRGDRIELQVLFPEFRVQRVQPRNVRFILVRSGMRAGDHDQRREQCDVLHH